MVVVLVVVVVRGPVDSFKCSANMAANQTGKRVSDTEGGSHKGHCYDFREQIREEKRSRRSVFKFHSAGLERSTGDVQAYFT